MLDHSLESFPTFCCHLCTKMSSCCFLSHWPVHFSMSFSAFSDKWIKICSQTTSTKAHSGGLRRENASRTLLTHLAGVAPKLRWNPRVRVWQKTCKLLDSSAVLAATWISCFCSRGFGFSLLSFPSRKCKKRTQKAAIDSVVGCVVESNLMASVEEAQTGHKRRGRETAVPLMTVPHSRWALNSVWHPLSVDWPRFVEALCTCGAILGMRWMVSEEVTSCDHNYPEGHGKSVSA